MAGYIECGVDNISFRIEIDSTIASQLFSAFYDFNVSSDEESYIPAAERTQVYETEFAARFFGRIFRDQATSAMKNVAIKAADDQVTQQVEAIAGDGQFTTISNDGTIAQGLAR